MHVFYYTTALFKNILKRLSSIRLLFIFLILVLSCSSNRMNKNTPSLREFRVSFSEFEKKFENLKEFKKSDVLYKLNQSKRLIDPVLYLYEQDETHSYVVDFFSDLTSLNVASYILYYSYKNEVPISLAFALAWTESDFKNNAVNKNPNSIDRGLFQLNDNTFRNLKIEDFFDLDTNTKHGMEYLKWCLEYTNSKNNRERFALYIYNAGIGRLRSNSIPRTTEIYAERVLSRKSKIIDSLFSYIEKKS